MKKKIYNSGGFTLVDLVIAMVIVSFLIIFIATVMNARSRFTTSASISREASDELENSLKIMSSGNFFKTDPGASFVRVYDANTNQVDFSRVELQPCSLDFCDFILDSDAGISGLRISPLGGVAWESNYQPPNGRAVKFVRRWSVEDFDRNLGLKRFTAAVFADETSSTPIIMYEIIASRP